MRVVSLHSQEVIEPVLRRNVYLHLYALGDLDPFFWQHTTWYGLEEHGSIAALLLLYSAPQTPTLLALSDPPYDALHMLIRSAGHLLPPSMYAHLSPGCSAIFAANYDVLSRGPHLKMALLEPAHVARVDTSAVTPLSAADADELRAFYAVSYPHAWFNPRMLEAGFCVGLRVQGELASAGSLHVYSRSQRVAALGGIATHPAHRGRGLATAVTARLCAVARDAAHIGLNVKGDNRAAVACYEKLGFRRVAEYEECVLTLKTLPGTSAKG
jgi:ribosomal protein S18 acetylase RimI-like enzyme